MEARKIDGNTFLDNFDSIIHVTLQSKTANETSSHSGPIMHRANYIMKMIRFLQQRYTGVSVSVT